MKIKKRSKKDINDLYQKIKSQRKEAGEKFNQDDFMALFGYKSGGRLFRLWKEGKRNPSDQCLILMEIIEGNKEVIQRLQLLKPQ